MSAGVSYISLDTIPIMKRPVHVCTHVNAPLKFRRFPSRRLFLPRDMQYTFMPRVREGAATPADPHIFPTRFHRFDTAEPSESSESLLSPGSARFPQPEISPRSGKKISSSRRERARARAWRTGDFTGLGNLLRREYSPVYDRRFSYSGVSSVSCVSFGFVPLASLGASSTK